MNYVSSRQLVLPDAEYVDFLTELRPFVVHVVHVDDHQR